MFHGALEGVGLSGVETLTGSLIGLAGPQSIAPRQKNATNFAAELSARPSQLLVFEVGPGLGLPSDSVPYLTFPNSPLHALVPNIEALSIRIYPAHLSCHDGSSSNQ
jgi:hypothetical protein